MVRRPCRMVGAMSRRRRRSAADLPVADRSPVELLLDDLRAARVGADGLRYDELPITVGLATLHADVVSSLPLRAVDADGNPATGRNAAPVILSQPDPDEDVADTVHKIAQSLYWTGNAFALVSWPPSGYAPALALKVVTPTTVGYLPDPADPLRVDRWLIDGVEYDRSAVAHWKTNDDPRSGPLGESPLAKCRRALDLYGIVYAHLGRTYADGGIPSQVLKSRLPIDGARAAELGDQWIAARQNRRPAVLPPDIELDVPGGDAGIVQLADLLAYCSAEVCRALNVPPSLGNAPSATGMTYANLNDELRRWLALSLGPTWLARIERGFGRLLPRGTFARFDARALLRADLLAGTTPQAVEL